MKSQGPIVKESIKIAASGIIVYQRLSNSSRPVFYQKFWVTGTLDQVLALKQLQSSLAAATLILNRQLMTMNKHIATAMAQSMEQ